MREDGEKKIKKYSCPFNCFNKKPSNPPRKSPKKKLLNSIPSPLK